MSTNVTISESLRAQYSNEGYFVLDSVIPENHLALLREVCAQAIDQMNAEMDRRNTDVLGINHRGKRYFAGQTFENHPILGDFLFSPIMAEICQATIGETAFLHNDQFVVKMEKTDMKFSWHQDSAYVQARVGDHPEHITCWCALDDTTEENGTIYLLPASRFGNRELVEHVRDPVTNDRTGYFGDDPGDPVTAKAGSIAVFSSLIFHRSGPNPSGSQRRAYLAQYAPAPIRNRPGEFPQYFAASFLEGGSVVR